jgi:hypothetical protein
MMSPEPVIRRYMTATQPAMPGARVEQCVVELPGRKVVWHELTMCGQVYPTDTAREAIRLALDLAAKFLINVSSCCNGAAAHQRRLQPWPPMPCGLTPPR